MSAFAAVEQLDAVDALDFLHAVADDLVADVHLSSGGAHAARLDDVEHSVELCERDLTQRTLGRNHTQEL